jgi:hypothetical protein
VIAQSKSPTNEATANLDQRMLSVSFMERPNERS